MPKRGSRSHKKRITTSSNNNRRQTKKCYTKLSKPTTPSNSVTSPQTSTIPIRWCKTTLRAIVETRTSSRPTRQATSSTTSSARSTSTHIPHLKLQMALLRQLWIRKLTSCRPFKLKTLSRKARRTRESRLSPMSKQPSKSCRIIHSSLCTSRMQTDPAL